MYVYIKSEPNLWTTGFYGNDGEWTPESDHPSPEEAAERVSFLNGVPEVNVRLTFSPDIPTVAGWYWHKDHHNVCRCIQVHYYKGKLCTEGFSWFGGRDYQVIRRDNSQEWAGPIELPKGGK